MYHISCNVSIRELNKKTESCKQSPNLFPGRGDLRNSGWATIVHTKSQIKLDLAGVG